jgi:succinate dehydrogenase/fumarate reductase flavoprotein subunit
MKRGALEVHPSRREFVKKTAAAGAAVAALGVSGERATAAPPGWDRSADVVIVGAGAAGLPAAIRARDRGASVILIDSNHDVGGHAMISGGSVALGGGTSLQKKFGIEDSADSVYLELTSPDHPMMRYSDRKLVRAFANINVEAFDFLVANGVTFGDIRPNSYVVEGVRTPRRQFTIKWSDDFTETINGGGGSGLVRALEKSARAKGVEILLQHKMTSVMRQKPMSGRVVGVKTVNLVNNAPVHIRARKAVVVCTGGSSSNVFIRTIFDPRLTEEINAGGEPWTLQSGDAEQCGMAIGAALGATNNARCEAYASVTKAKWIGCRDGYMRWDPKSPVFHKAGATGISVSDYQDVILVNCLGRRFHNELAPNYEARLNVPDGARAAYDYCAAAFASAVVEGSNGAERIGGPIWAIFDSDAAAREKWELRPPFVDVARHYFSTADTLGELARKLSQNQHQKVPMSAVTLEQTVAKYNLFVDAGTDTDFGKPTPKYKIQMPPFHAAWATPVLHDCYSGLRVNDKCQVMDVFGNVIPGFYCAGESAGGFTLHGLGRCIGTGYLAGTYAAAETAGKPSSR